jgi:hypothetical protein
VPLTPGPSPRSTEARGDELSLFVQWTIPENPKLNRCSNSSVNRKQQLPSKTVAHIHSPRDRARLFRTSYFPWNRETYGAVVPSPRFSVASDPFLTSRMRVAKGSPL